MLATFLIFLAAVLLTIPLAIKLAKKNKHSIPYIFIVYIIAAKVLFLYEFTQFLHAMN